MESFGNVHILIMFVVLYSVIILNGLRAYVIFGNATSTDNNIPIVGKNNDIASDSQLLFLEGFVFKDTGEPLVIDHVSKAKRISKRSIRSSVVPQYMREMYQYLSSRKYKVKFDTARSFRSSSKSEQNFTSRQLMFNISSFPAAEIVQFAQLRIQLQPHIPAEIIGTKMKLEVYSVENRRTTNVFPMGEATLSRNFLWAINLTALLQVAVESRILELNLVVEISPPGMDEFFLWDASDGEGPQLLLLSRSRFETAVSDGDPLLQRIRRSLSERTEDFPLESEEGDKISIDFNSSSRRMKRSEEDDEEAEEQSNFIVEELGRIRKGKLKKKKNPCKRKPLHVNFSAINYDQWILAPPSYEAFECSGKCSFPMSAHLTPTKHAIIQTLMHSLEPKQISRACCVPTKLNSISVLYIDDDGTVTYKYDYEDMVVSECGCR